MFRPLSFLLTIIGLLSLNLLDPEPSLAQQESIASQHVRMLVPAERGSIGREVISDIERFYEFANRATGSSLPQKIQIVVNWNQSESSCQWPDAGIIVGMKQPAAAANLRTFLFHSAAREIARLGLLELSGGAQREDTEFLFEGMIEILVHEFDHSSRKLEAAWVFSKMFDEMKILGLASQRSWSTYSDGLRCLRNAAPGITFLTTFRELQSRDRPLKLFEALRKSSLTASLTETFRAPSAELENIWLKRVREYPINDEITTMAEEAPQLSKSQFVPDAGKPGSILQLRLFIEDRARNLLPNGVFVKDIRTGRLLRVLPSSENGIDYLLTEIPIDENCPPGEYAYQITAIDESGNLRRWNGNYVVASK
jgi:hypothetical protein